MAVALLLYLIAEIAAVWAVASVIGIGWTILALLAGAVIGSWLARREGGKVARELFTATGEGRSGHREITEGMLIALGGLLILLPGFLTDIAGIVVILPPARGAIRRYWLRKVERAAQWGPTTRGPGGAAGGVRFHRTVVVDGEVVSDSGYQQRDARDQQDPEDDGEGPRRSITP
ncbi:FxsA family protein [Haloechinothrix sp. LS1_15]|uniref:FxsA family protein n=1 Tax=Haloechinothrix sp. LS1_15 TaxID=2652248 RepID=UPI002946B985|nr:FxsA family protein [Haloechinothrix sp. LS1_15]MDV6011054.1 FxsA family protein [Haloechinothrix sp. LS1_15]